MITGQLSSVSRMKTVAPNRFINGKSAASVKIYMHLKLEGGALDHGECMVSNNSNHP